LHQSCETAVAAVIRAVPMRKASSERGSAQPGCIVSLDRIPLHLHSLPVGRRSPVSRHSDSRHDEDLDASSMKRICRYADPIPPRMTRRVDRFEYIFARYSSVSLSHFSSSISWIYLFTSSRELSRSVAAARIPKYISRATLIFHRYAVPA
jgi:hypothetical protein